MSKIREAVSFTKGHIVMRGELVIHCKAKCTDYVLYYKPNINHAVGDGMS